MWGQLLLFIEIIFSQTNQLYKGMSSSRAEVAGNKSQVAQCSNTQNHLFCCNEFVGEKKPKKKPHFFKLQTKIIHL